MANVTVRNIDNDVITCLKAQAKANHRSLEGEIRHLLAQQVLRHTRLEDFRERTARLGALTADRPQTDSVSLLREDREPLRLIVDASVAVKWLFTEEGTAESRQLLAHRIVLHAPDFILTEVANVLWKKARRNEVADAQPYLEELARLPDAVVLRPSADLVAHAAAIAFEIDHPIYDCLYLACADAEGAPLVTADGKLRDAAQGYPGVDVWHIADPEVGERIVTAATALVIEEATVRELIAAYAAFNDTVDSVIDTVPRRRSGVRILTPEDQDTYLDTPAYLRLVKRIANLSYDERIDLMALAWFGRETTRSSPWSDFLNHAYRMGNDDPHYEAGLGRHWQAGLDRLRGELRNNA